MNHKTVFVSKPFRQSLALSVSRFTIFYVCLSKNCSTRLLISFTLVDPYAFIAIGLNADLIKYMLESMSDILYTLCSFLFYFRLTGFILNICSFCFLMLFIVFCCYLFSTTLAPNGARGFTSHYDKERVYANLKDALFLHFSQRQG